MTPETATVPAEQMPAGGARERILTAAGELFATARYPGGPSF